MNSTHAVRPKKLYMSQSLIKSLIKKWYESDDDYIKPHCPRQIYHLFFKKDYKLEKEVFEKGNFGESLLLGLTADGSAVTELPKNKKTGEDRIDETRIRRMADIAKIYFVKHQIPVHEGINTQFPLIRHIERDVYIRTKLDLFPTSITYDPDGDGKEEFACIDVKFPKSLEGFGEYDWSDFENLDHCQPQSIYWQMESLDMKLMKSEFAEYEASVGFDNVLTKKALRLLPHMKFYYFVVAYKSVTSDNIMILPYEKKRDDIIEFEERMKRAIALVEYYFEMGFDPIPYINIRAGMGCHKCPVNKKLFPETGYCEDFIEP